ncbi:Zinc finger, C3HC4 type (RING finger) [Geosmithia morbida]|uniref:Zinc finger, C3HC4 type (RING finger) n=1 Tax=Geosmithia morbida TaxID=1094350 RepID=A0A9P4YRS8_9HYPO|nr:Zinc finger, C3HC4 type (RING finger) [Geosmithia morbida]KAF4120652.1 Zinc finger, C3HC4 type (RING finger) [Geosmithia morbida]
MVLARRKLSAVTATRSAAGPVAATSQEYAEEASVRVGRDGYGDIDVESTAAQLEIEKCPICIGPMMPKPAVLKDSKTHRTLHDGNTREALAELSTVASERCRRIRNMGRSIWEKLKKSQQRDEVQHGNRPYHEYEVILTLNKCGHTFHSQCLAMWYLMGRYDCPVCRQRYYTPRKRRQIDLPAFTLASLT